jgi:hypothetical protein
MVGVCLRIKLQPDAVTGQEMALVRGSVRNAMIYGTLHRIKCASGLGVYERLLGFWRSQQLEARLLSSSSSSSNDKTDGSTSSKASWQSFPECSPTPSKKSIPQDFDKTARYYVSTKPLFFHVFSSLFLKNLPYSTQFKSEQGICT